MVATEFNAGEMEGVLAATPPLEVLRSLSSEAATRHLPEYGTKVMIVNDVPRAFFEAHMSRGVCVELPLEA